MSGARIEDDEGAFVGVERGVGEREDLHQRVIDGALQPASIDNQLEGELEDVGGNLVILLEMCVAAFAQDVEKKHAALPGVDQ